MRISYVLAVFCGLLSLTCRPVAQMDPNQLALSALFTQFETVCLSDATRLSDLHPERASASPLRVLRVPFAELLGELGIMGDNVVSDLIGKADNVIVGARNFQQPANLGSVQSDFCYILVYRKGSAPELGSRLHAAAIGSEHGFVILSWLSKPTESRRIPVPLYATQVGPGYILVSNTRSGLQKTSDMLASASNTSSLTSIRDWGFISRHRFWAYRRFQQTVDVDHRMAASDVPLGADALAFVLDKAENDALVRLYASGRSIAEAVDARGSLPSFQLVADGIWQSVISLAPTEKAKDAILTVMGMLGFGVYL